MEAWLLLLLVIGVCLVVLFILRRSSRVEGFDASKQIAFNENQYSDIVNRLATMLYVDPGLDVKTIDNAAHTTELLDTKTDVKDYKQLFIGDPYLTALDDNERMCKRAAHPRDLPRHDGTRTMNCGWWFVPNSNQPSVAALGTPTGPLITDTLPKTGQWVWDLDKAAELEDFKECKRIRSCALISTEGIAGKCGFCTDRGYAVPITTNGQEKYPNSEDGCGGKPVRDAGDCPSGSATTTSEVLRRARPDGTTEYVTTDEKGDVQVARDVCDPDNEGYISVDCLKHLAKHMGFTTTGALMRFLDKKGTSNETDTLALEFVRKAGANVPEVALGKGKGAIDPQTAGNVYQSIYRLMRYGEDDITKAAAIWMVDGSVPFKPCPTDDKTQGPFIDKCLQQLFRKAGCQAAGREYPTGDKVQKYKDMTWGEIRTTFQDLYSKTKSGDSKRQDPAMMDCMGIEFKRTERKPCVYTPTVHDETVNAAIRFWQDAIMEGRWRLDNQRQKATAISIGSDNSVYALWSGRLFKKSSPDGTWIQDTSSIQGKIASISAQNVTTALAITFDETLWLMSGGTVSELTKGCVSASIGEDGSYWALLRAPGRSGAEFYRREGSNLTKMSSSVTTGRQILVADEKNVYHITGEGTLVKWESGKWVDVLPNVRTAALTRATDGIYCAAILRNGDLYAFDSSRNVTNSSNRLRQVAINSNYLVGTTDNGTVVYIDLFEHIKNDWGKYVYQGCFKDSPNRALPHFLGHVKTPTECIALGSTRSMDTVGTQYYSECWGGNNTNYDKYGPETGNCQTMGTDWNNIVYSRGVGTNQEVFGVAPFSIISQEDTNYCVQDIGLLPGLQSQVLVELCSNASEQRYTMDASGRLKNQQTGNCLTVKDGSTKDGTEVVSAPCVNDASQRFTHDQQGRLIAEHSGKCIRTKSAAGLSTELEQYTCGTSASATSEIFRLGTPEIDKDMINPRPVSVLAAVGQGPWNLVWTFAIPRQGSPKWIWTNPSGIWNETNWGPVYMFKIYHTARDIEATMIMAIDNEGAMFNNDVQLGNYFSTLGRVDFTLKKGRNKFLVRAANRGGPAGILGVCHRRGNPNDTLFVTDHSWFISSGGIGDKGLKARFFEHCDYNGAVSELGPGNYDLAAMGIANDVISSVRVPQGLTVTLYEHAGFTGRSLVLRGDARCLVDQGFNDTVSSIRIS